MNSKIVLALLLIASCQFVMAAKIYKCKDASGHVTFSNHACDAENLNKGKVGHSQINVQESESYPDTYSHRPGMSASEIELMRIKNQNEREARERALEKSRGRLEQKMTQYEADRLEREKQAAARKKANCNFYQERADYYKKKSRHRDSWSGSKDYYKSKRDQFESYANSGC